MQQEVFTMSGKLTPQGVASTLKSRGNFMDGEEKEKQKPTINPELEKQLNMARLMVKKMREVGANKEADEAEKELIESQKKLSDLEDGIFAKIAKVLLVALKNLFDKGPIIAEKEQLEAAKKEIENEVAKRKDVQNEITDPQAQQDEKSRQDKFEKEREEEEKAQREEAERQKLIDENAAITDPETRKVRALAFLKEKFPEKWKEESTLTPQQAEALLAAHNFGEHTVREYTVGELLGKTRILKYGANEVGKPNQKSEEEQNDLFTKKEIRELMRYGHVGHGVASKEHVKNATGEDTYEALENPTDPELARRVQKFNRAVGLDLVDVDVINDTYIQVRDGILAGVVDREEGQRVINSLEGWKRLTEPQRRTRQEQEPTRQRKNQSREASQLTEEERMIREWARRPEFEQLEIAGDFFNQGYQPTAEQIQQWRRVNGNKSLDGETVGDDVDQNLHFKVRAEAYIQKQDPDKQIEIRLQTAIDESTTLEDARINFSKVKRYVNALIKSDREGTLKNLDSNVREELKMINKIDAGSASKQEIQKHATKLGEFHLAQYFKTYEPLPEEKDRALPRTLEGLLDLIATNDAPEYQAGGDKALTDEYGNVQYENLLAWLRNRIVLLHDNAPDDPINVFNEINVLTLYQKIDFNSIILNKKWANNLDWVVRGDASKLSEGGAVVAKERLTEDKKWDKEKWQLFQEAFLLQTSHNWDVLYKASRGSFDKLGDLMKSMFGKNIFTKEGRLLKVIGLSGRDATEYDAYIDKQEQGRVGMGIQRSLAAFDHLAELVASDEQLFKLDEKGNPIKDESGQAIVENQFKDVLGTDGMNTFWLSTAANVLGNKNLDYAGKERVQSTYKDFVKSMLHKEYERVARDGEEDIKRLIDDAISDVDDKTYDIRFEDMDDLYNLRVLIARRRASKTGKEEDKVDKVKRSEIRKGVRAEVAEGIKDIIPTALVGISGKGDENNLLTSADIQLYNNDDKEAFGLAILAKIGNIKKDDLNIFAKSDPNELTVETVRKGITNAVCRDLNLDSEEASYAELWANSMTGWGGLVSKNDVAAAAYDGRKRVDDIEGYRRKQQKNRQPGNLQNLPLFRHMGLGLLDYVAAAEEGTGNYKKSFMEIVNNYDENGKINMKNEPIKLKYVFKTGLEKHYGEVYMQNVIDVFNILTKPDNMYFGWEKMLKVDTDGRLIVTPEIEDKLWDILKAFRYTEQQEMLYGNKIRSTEYDKNGKIRFVTTDRRHHMYGEKVIKMFEEEEKENEKRREKGEKIKDSMAKKAFGAWIMADLLERRRPGANIPVYSWDFIELVERYFATKNTEVVTDPNGKEVFVESKDSYFDHHQREELLKKAKSDYVNVGLPADIGSYTGGVAAAFGIGIKTFFKKLTS